MADVGFPQKEVGLQLPIESHPDKQLHVLVFDEVSNALEISQWVRQPGADFAAIDARMVVGVPQLFAASMLAVHAEERGKLVTHALPSEVVYALSASKQINEAFRRFGASETSARIVIVTFDAAAAARLHDAVRGKLADPRSLATSFDDTAVRKAYRISETELRVSSLLDAIVSRIAIARL
ncbi:kinase binding protein CGI-121-domain-containing protein, partial [Pavlovales sp. CCMP2436]